MEIIAMGRWSGWFGNWLKKLTAGEVVYQPGERAIEIVVEDPGQLILAWELLPRLQGVFLQDVSLAEVPVFIRLAK